MIKRLGSAAAGAGLLILGVYGQLSAPPSSVVEPIHAVSSLASVLAVLLVWWRKRSREETLEWRTVTRWSVLGGGLSGGVLGLLGWRLISTLTAGIGNGLVIGLLMSLVHYGIRGPRGEADESQLDG